MPTNPKPTAHKQKLLMKGIFINTQDLESLLAGFCVPYKGHGMDPLSVIAGVLGITTVAVESSKKLFELVDAVRSAPDEIRNISRDVHAFYSILFSLQSSLQDPQITVAIAEDEPLTALVGNLREPLGNCTSVLGQLMVKIQSFVKPSDEGQWRMTSNDLRWYLGKREINDLTSRVEACKTTLNTGLTAVGALCSVRTFAAGNGFPSKPIRRSSNDTDAGFALRRFVEEKDKIRNDSDSLAPPSSLTDTFNAHMKLESENTLVGNRARSSNRSPSRIEQLRRKENQRDGLLEAARQGDSILVEVAVEEGADINAKGVEGKSALHEAAIKGHIDVVQALLDLNADVNIRQTPRGDSFQRKFQGLRTPLHWAAEKGHEDIVRLLLEGKAEINAKNLTDRTPLQEAVMGGHTRIAELLLEKGAMVSIRDDEHWTCLHQAASDGHAHLIHVFLDKGCDIEARTSDSNIWNFNQTKQATPLYLASGNGHEAAVKALLARGADPRSRNITGEMPLHLASWRGFVPIVRIMLDAGVDIEEKDIAFEETPLLKAASTGQTGVLKLLLDRGADMDAMTQWGRNALAHAQLHQEGNEEAVQLLKEAYRKRAKGVMAMD